jgi:hypothetical protein
MREGPKVCSDTRRLCDQIQHLERRLTCEVSIVDSVLIIEADCANKKLLEDRMDSHKNARLTARSRDQIKSGVGGIKCLAGFLGHSGHSFALVADGVESFSDIVSSTVVFFSHPSLQSSTRRRTPIRAWKGGADCVHRRQSRSYSGHRIYRRREHPES